MYEYRMPAAAPHAWPSADTFSPTGAAADRPSMAAQRILLRRDRPLLAPETTCKRENH